MYYGPVMTLFTDFNQVACAKKGGKRDVEENQCFKAGQLDCLANQILEETKQLKKK